VASASYYCHCIDKTEKKKTWQGMAQYLDCAIGTIFACTDLILVYSETILYDWRGLVESYGLHYLMTCFLAANQQHHSSL
jgi:hypothetical protein